MHFVPIPTTREELEKYKPLWFPFLASVSKRSKESIASLVRKIELHDVQIALVWDEDNKKPHALVGIHYVLRDNDVIGEVIWLTGTGMRRWLPLLPELERFLKDMGCAEIRPICRPGWSRLIKGEGYKVTHYMMEKTL